MSTKFIEAEFYYRSGSVEHLRMLQLLEAGVAAARVEGIEITLAMINCDEKNVTLPSDIPTLPCLRRILPTPERLLLGAIRTEDEFRIMLGLPKSRLNCDTDRFSGWTGATNR
jgi:hypothetical protein